MDIKCSHCGKEMSVRDEALGKWGRCKYCHEKIQALPNKIDTSEQPTASGAEFEAKVAAEVKRRLNEAKVSSNANQAFKEERKELPTSKQKEISTSGANAIGCIFTIIIFAIFYWYVGDKVDSCLESPKSNTPRSVQHQQSVSKHSQRVTPNRTNPLTRQQILSPTQSRSNNESPEAKCKAIAQHEYPNDSDMQQYIYKQQIAAYRYISSVKDQEVIGIALNEYPNDYAMQKFVYDQQVAAKNYISKVGDREVKRIALNEYPNDYAMQKFVYDQQVAAKNYMNTVSNGLAKQKAIREYPNDYAMQKFVYDK